MKQHPTLGEWTAFHREHKAAHTKLVDWISEQRKQAIVEHGPGCTLTMESNYREWFTIGRMLQFLEEHTRDGLERSNLTIACDESKRWFIYDSQLVEYRKRLAVRRELCDALWDVVKSVIENDATSVRTDETSDERTIGGPNG